MEQPVLAIAGITGTCTPLNARLIPRNYQTGAPRSITNHVD